MNSKETKLPVTDRTAIEIEPASDPAYPRWKVKDVAYSESAGVVTVKATDIFGTPLGGVWVWAITDHTESDAVTDRNGETTFVLDAPEVYSVYVRESNYETNLLVPTETVKGIELPNGYAITFQRLVAPDDSNSTKLEEAILSAAKKTPWMPINNTGALWRYAKQHNLEDAQTDELETEFDGKTYTLQVFNLGIVYAPKGAWEQIKVISK